MKKIYLFLSLFLSVSLTAGDQFYSWGPPPSSFGGPFDAAAYRMSGGNGFWQAPYWYVSD